MPSPRISRYTRVVTYAIVCTLALMACGSDGVIHNGSDGVSYSGGSASSADLQSAASQITKAFESDVIAPSAVVSVLTLEPQVTKLGQQHGIAVSNDQITAAFPKVKFNSTALSAMRCDELIAELEQAGVSDSQVKNMLQKAKVTINPRYGVWVPGQGAVSITEPWISASLSSSAVSPEVNDHSTS